MICSNFQNQKRKQLCWIKATTLHTLPLNTSHHIFLLQKRTSNSQQQDLQQLLFTALSVKDTAEALPYPPRHQTRLHAVEAINFSHYRETQC